MVIKDMYCLSCGHVRGDEIVDSCDTTTAVFPCPQCQRRRVHGVVCNGGTRLKPYVCTYDGRDFSGDISYLGCEAVYEPSDERKKELRSQGRPVLEGDVKDNGTGKAVADRFNSTLSDRVGEKRDRKSFEHRKLFGRDKLTVDQASR